MFESVTLYIASDTLRPAYKIVGILLWVSFALFFPSVFFFPGPMNVIFVIIGILSGITLAVLKERDIIGELNINYDTITTEIGSECNTHSIDNIEYIRICYSSYEGQNTGAPFSKSFAVSKGIENHIVFSKDGQEISCRVLIREYDLVLLTNLILRWKELGRNICLEDTAGRELKSFYG